MSSKARHSTSNRPARNARFWRWLARERQFCSPCYALGKRTQIGSVTEIAVKGPAVYAATLRLRLIAHFKTDHPHLTAKIDR